MSFLDNQKKNMDLKKNNNNVKSMALMFYNYKRHNFLRNFSFNKIHYDHRNCHCAEFECHRTNSLGVFDLQRNHWSHRFCFVRLE